MAAKWAGIVVVGTLMVGAGIPAEAGDSNEKCPVAAAIPNQIRTASCEMTQAIAIGVSTSPTFRRLLERVAALRGIVYLTAKPIVQTEARRVINGTLQHRVTVSGSYRLLYVTVTPYSGPRAIAIIAHELQHAIEVLESDATTDQAIVRLFERIGTRAGAQTMETAAALDIQRTVMNELATARRRPTGR
jgi:hypothetical protein